MLSEKEEVKTLSVKLTKGEHDAIKQLSQARGVSISDLVKASIWFAQFKDSNPEGYFGKG